MNVPITVLPTIGLTAPDETPPLGAALPVSIPEPDQYAQMPDAAAEGGDAYPAVNMSSSETVNAALPE